MEFMNKFKIIKVFKRHYYKYIKKTFTYIKMGCQIGYNSSNAMPLSLSVGDPMAGPTGGNPIT